MGALGVLGVDSGRQFVDGETAGGEGLKFEHFARREA